LEGLKLSSKQEKSRVRIEANDTAATLEQLHKEWRRGMAIALGAVKTQAAAVERMNATQAVLEILGKDES
jgi:hypothetical protein